MSIKFVLIKNDGSSCVLNKTKEYLTLIFSLVVSSKRTSFIIKLPSFFMVLKYFSIEILVGSFLIQKLEHSLLWINC